MTPSVVATFTRDLQVIESRVRIDQAIVPEISQGGWDTLGIDSTTAVLGVGWPRE
jgi:hypothetical protein